MSGRLDPAKHEWMRWPETRAAMAALTAGGGEARFVGGAVRNALLGEPVTDVDIATPLTPEEVTKRLEAAGLQAVPTGMAHGTVTAVASGKPFEVTTLRRDVTTDGRRAVVAFTKDWAEDAARRDFTINAIYATEKGELFDPTGGVGDLKAGRVRFVGDAEKRIREDYLRILRLFRFHAWYGKGEVDKPALAAASAEKAGLKKLSGERVQKELLKLLDALDPIPVLATMEEVGILSEILPPNPNIPRLKNLVEIDTARRCGPIIRLGALISNVDHAKEVADRLKLSSADRDRLLVMAETLATSLAKQPLSFARALRYRQGRERFMAILFLNWAEHVRSSEQNVWDALVNLAEYWQPPKFPLDGRDAMAAGVKEGPAVGKILGELERWWIENDFKPDRAALLQRLKSLAR